LKVEEKYIGEEDFDKIALVAPRASINIIRNGRVVKKKKVRMPAKIVGVFACPNPKCISNFELMQTCFFTEEGGTVRCGYCERPFLARELL
jgi:aspartate carbamoyltransferase regulatory subunit